MNYTLVAGTGGYRAPWVKEDSDFCRMMTSADFHSLLVGGRHYGWSGRFDGADGDNSEWESFAQSLYFYARDLAYVDLNFFGHSHGGNIILLLAASGFRIRSLTTIGTPIRPEINLAKAEDNIGFHQHIMDDRFDAWGFLGGWRLGRFDLLRKRSMPDPRVLNIPVHGISHTKVLTDPKHISKWITEGWLANIVTPPGVPAA